MTIAISGKSGCGNSTVSRMLAERLGLPFVNYTFRNMAQELGIDLNSLLEKAKIDESWDRKLDARQIALARRGPCVLGSRLAIWLLEEADLKVYLSASPETRAKRIHEREGGSYEATFLATIKRDEEDRRRYLALYGIDNDDSSIADLVIDTELYAPPEIIMIILERLKVSQKGLA
jgi:cytidylate kinase